MKNITRYFVIFIVLLFSIILTYFDSINLYGILDAYFSASKSEILLWNTGGIGYSDISEINIFRHLSLIFNQEFSSGITYASSFLGGYSIFIYVIPFLGLFSSFSIIDRKKSIGSLIPVRINDKQSYFNFYFRTILKECLSVSLLTYSAYLLYALFITLFYGFGLPPTDSFDFLVNALTLKLFGNYGTLFFMFSAIFSIMVGTFIIVFLVCVLGYIVEEKIKLFLLVVLYFFGSSFILNTLGIFIPEISIYLSPLTLLNPFPYQINHSFLLIGINLIPIVFAFLILKIDSVKYEIS